MVCLKVRCGRYPSTVRILPIRHRAHDRVPVRRGKRLPERLDDRHEVIADRYALVDGKESLALCRWVSRCEPRHLGEVVCVHPGDHIAGVIRGGQPDVRSLATSSSPHWELTGEQIAPGRRMTVVNPSELTVFSATSAAALVAT